MCVCAIFVCVCHVCMCDFYLCTCHVCMCDSCLCIYHVYMLGLRLCMCHVCVRSVFMYVHDIIIYYNKGIFSAELLKNNPYYLHH